MAAPAALFTTELALLRATSSLWAEYPPFAGDVERIVRDNNMAVFAHVVDNNLGQCLFGDEDLSARLRPHWMSRWEHPDNANTVDRVRHFAACHGVETRDVSLAWILARPFPVLGVIELPTLLTQRSAMYERVIMTRFNHDELQQLATGIPIVE
jgi:aryl-alcohol dehydrogenase-like predicted oxidoreductase